MFTRTVMVWLYVFGQPLYVTKYITKFWLYYLSYRIYDQTYSHHSDWGDVMYSFVPCVGDRTYLHKQGNPTHQPEAQNWGTSLLLVFCVWDRNHRLEDTFSKVTYRHVEGTSGIASIILPWYMLYLANITYKPSCAKTLESTSFLVKLTDRKAIVISSVLS